MHFDFMALVTAWDPADEKSTFFAKLGDEFKKRGYRIAFITRSRFADGFMQKAGHTYFNFYDLTRELKSNHKINYPAEAERIEQTYGININNYVLAESMLQKPHVKNDQQLGREVVEDFLMVEKFLEEHQVGCFIQDQGGEILRRTLTQVGRLRNVSSVWLSFSPIKGCMILRPDEYDSSIEIRRIMDSYTPDQEEIAQAEKYIKSFKENRKMYLHSKQLSSGINPLSLWKPFRHLYRKYAINKGQEPRKVLAGDFRIIQMKLRKILCDVTLPREFLQGKFFFFPLHLPRESQLTVRAPQCVNQEDIVDIVARSLPYGYKLYVKEHPNHIGEIPFKAIRQIARTRDVVLLHPKVHSHQLIQESAGVVTIDSTAGFEAILLQKPVVVLGKPFYYNLGFTIDVQDYFYIPEALHKAIELRELSYDKIPAFVDALFKVSYAGTYGNGREDNIKAVADSILGYLRKVVPGEHMLNL